METPVESGDRLGAQGCSLATPCRAHVPSPGAPSPPRSRARRRRLRTVPWAGGRAGGAALRLRPKPLEAGRPRAGPGGTYRARGGGGERGAPAGSCGAVCGPREAGAAPPGGSGRRPAGLAAAPRGSAGLGCAARCLRPRAGARCGGAASRAAPTSGVSPLQIGSEGGGSGGRDAKKKERAGALGRSLRARRRGRLSRAGPRPLLPVALEPRAGLRRGPTARRSYRGRPGRRPRGRAESPAPRLVLKRPPPDFSALGLLSNFPPARPSGRARPPGDKDGSVPFCGNRVLQSCSEGVAPQSTEPRHQETVLPPQSCGAPNLSAPGRATRGWSALLVP